MNSAESASAVAVEDDAIPASARSMAPTEPSRPGQRVGGRSGRVIRDVLAAAAEELSAGGYAGLRVDDVAARAGVNKTTIYRRWPTKAALVDATIRAMKGPQPVPPDLGALRLDLLALAREAVARASTCDGRCIHRMITLEIDHPEVAAIARAIRAEYLAAWSAVVAQGVARGELPQHTDADLLVEVIVGPIFARIRMREEVTEAYLQAVVDVVIAGAKAGAGTRRTSS